MRPASQFRPCKTSCVRNGSNWRSTHSGAGEATLGGLIATNFNGYRRYGLGAIRDHVIGISAVDGRGQMFKGGGRVVKNVAGYDFCKLLTGSLGTLGIITQVTLKLRPLPEAHAFVVCVPGDLLQAERWLTALGRSSATPTAVELLVGACWRETELAAIPRFSKANDLVLVLALEGTKAEVDWMIQRFNWELQREGASEVDVFSNAARLHELLVEFPQRVESPLTVRANVVPAP